MEKYVELLKEKGLKLTHHRLAILKYISDHRNHPTAEQIYNYLKKSDPGLSRTTIYNNLETLTNTHIIKQLTICPTEHHYDFNDTMHHHFICKDCGAIFDIDIQCPAESKIKKYVISQGHRIDEVHGYLKGLCRDCLNKKGNR